MQRIVGLFSVVIGVVYLFSLVRRNLLTPKYTYIWLASLALIGIFILFPDLTDIAQRELDFSLQSNFLFSVLFVILFFTIIQLGKDLVVLIHKVEKIVERIALQEIQRIENRKDKFE